MTAAVIGTGPGDLLQATLRDHLGAVSPRLVVLALSKDENPKATVLAFTPGRPSPRLVVKVALTEGAGVAIRAEAAALGALAALDTDLVHGTVPRLVDERHDAAGAVLVTQAMPGVPMSVDYHRWRHTATPELVRHDFSCARSWLQDLDSVGVPSKTPARGYWPTVATRLCARWPEDDVALDVAQRVADHGASMGLPPDVPPRVVHGDFWCGNVLRAMGVVTGVVDWEHAELGGDPLRDLTRFVLSYLLYLDRHTRPGRSVRGHLGLTAGPWGEPIRYAVHGRGWLSVLVEQVLSDALADTGRDRQLWRAALALGAAEVAAQSDHGDFARRHLLLAAELLR
jgi:hypothetical protein